AQAPQLRVGDGARGPVAPGGVVGAELRARETAHLRVGPGGRVYAVGDRGDRHVIRVESRPERAEHVAADVTVQAGDAVGALRETQPHDGHVEGARRAALVVL